VVIVGGGYLFWPRGGGTPTGIGERYSVVTADSTTQPAPRSGSVDINGEVAPLVPEAPAGTPTSGTDAPRQPVVVADTAADDEPARPEASQPEVTTPRVEKPKTARPKTTTPPPAEPTRITPAASGRWAVQLGAFKTHANAEKVVQELAAKGLTAHVRAANTSSGEMIHRVWIGWFSSRDQAQRFAAQEKSRIGDAYPVTR
jgi:DedD protein